MGLPSTTATPLCDSFPTLVRDLLAFYLNTSRRKAPKLDTLHTAIARALGNLGNYQPHPEGPRPWAFGILRNVGRERSRAHKRERELFRPDFGHAERTSAPDPSPEDAAWCDEVRPKLIAAIMALPDRLLAVFVLVHIEGRSHAECAALLNIPLGTVKSRQHEALARLREALGPKENYFSADPPLILMARLRKLLDLSYFWGHLLCFAMAGLVMRVVPERLALAKAGLYVPSIPVEAPIAAPAAPVPASPATTTPPPRRTNPIRTAPKAPEPSIEELDKALNLSGDGDLHHLTVNGL